MKENLFNLAPLARRTCRCVQFFTPSAHLNAINCKCNNKDVDNNNNNNNNNNKGNNDIDTYNSNKNTDNSIKDKDSMKNKNTNHYWLSRAEPLPQAQLRTSSSAMSR